jgi:branched-chain amino acid transport system substrate-binding protein
MKIATLKSGLGLCLVSIVLAGTASRAHGQSTPGVSESEIVIGSCSALEGPSHFLGVETVTGAKAYFNLINDEGGVNGRKIKLVSADDSYDPAKTQACFDHLMSEKVFALGFFVGTPTAVKYVPMADGAKIPLVGLFTGAQTLYVPLRHWIVNVRASYFDETREQVDGLWKTLGYKKIGVIYPEDAFGTTVLEGVKNALKEHGTEPAAVASYQRQTAQVGGAIDTVRAANPDAVIVVGPANTVAPI